MGNKESGGPPPATQSRPAQGNQALDAITQNRETEVVLDKKIALLNTKIAEQRKLAKERLSAKTDKAGNQARAKRHLQQARKLQQQVDNFEKMKDNLEAVRFNLESAELTKTMTQTMKTGTNVMKTMAKDLKQDDLEDMLDDLNEATETLNDATNMISTPIAGDPGVELDAENDLEDLMAELEGETEESAPTKAPVIDLPMPPTSIKKRDEDDDVEDELSALMRDMN